MKKDEAVGRLRDLQSVTDAALGYLPLEELLTELLRRVTEILYVDTAVVLLIDEADETLVPRAAFGLEEEVGRGIRIPLGAGFAGRVAASREPIRIDDPEHADIVNPILRQKGLKGLLGVPLVVEGRAIGVMHIGSLTPREFTDEDVDLLSAAADRAALSIYGRLAERERGLADALQTSLIPVLPDLPGIDMVGRYLPAASERLGGDWYDAFSLPGGKIGLAIGDVVGRGFQAAALMGQLRSGLRAYALDGVAPAGVLERLSNLLRQLAPGRSATVLYAAVDPQGGVLNVASAGHPAPLVIGPDDAAQFVELAGSVPLGATRSPSYEEREIRLEPCSTLVLYTDGLVERAGERLQQGLDRLADLATEHVGDGESMADTLIDLLLPSGPSQDDAALLVARVLPLGDPLTLRHQAEIDEIPLLRRLLGRWLVEAGASREETEDVTLAFSEACANAAEHAYAPASGILEIEARTSAGSAIVSVRDFGSWREPRGVNRGRGLILMQGLMDSVEVIQDGDGTAVQLKRKLEGLAE